MVKVGALPVDPVPDDRRHLPVPSLRPGTSLREWAGDGPSAATTPSPPRPAWPTMCGIAGVYHRNGAPVDRAALVAMTGVQRHRGPDDQGAHSFSLRRSVHLSCSHDAGREDDGLEGGVGFNRLSILDLSQSGHQPMVGPSQQVLIAFNGEVYNAFDHRAELESSGGVFSSRTDTEVLLHLYERHGIDGMLERLNGMFAMCIVDLREGAMYLARDRLGIKPMYWWERDGTFLFASEMKSFLYHPEFRARLDASSIDEYLAFRYCAGERTMLEGVRELEPGHWLRVNPDGHIKSRYWDLPAPSDTTRSMAESAVGFERHLRRSVEMRLLSDVTVGCQLSGGIDSSLVTAFATDASASRFDAVSVVVPDARFSEEHWMDQVVAQEKVRVHKAQLTPEYFAAHLERATWHMDQPLNLPNALGIYLLAETAASVVKVLLSGEGADELLAGYPRSYYAALRSRMAGLLPLLYRFPKVEGRFGYLLGRWGRVDPVDWAVTVSAFIGRTTLMDVRPDARPGPMIARRRAVFRGGAGDFLSDFLSYELRTYLVDLLMRQDRMTMAHSIENRVPFLDHQLVEYVRSLPSSHLADGSIRGRRNIARHTKLIPKQLAAHRFDESFAYRKKSGFDLPLSRYFSTPSFVEMMEDALLPGMRGRGVVDGGRVEGTWRRMCAEPDGSLVTDAEAQSVWAAIAFEQWAALWLDRPAAEPKRSTSPSL